MKTKPQILPEELLIEILLRLPVKSLVRFKCVSKAWFSLIANPHFAHSHFNLALAPTHRLLFFSEYYKEFVSMDFNAPSLYDDIVILNFSLFQSSLVRVIGSCRGFILYMEGYASLFILNPSTGVHKELPSPASWDCLISPFLFGFGYEPSTDDYLVTLVYSSYGDPEVNRAEIFSVRANKWKEVDGVDLSYLLCGADDEVIGLQFGRAIHWLHYDNDRERMPIIVAFDLVERVFYKIPLPNDFDGDIEACQLQEIGGHLGIYDAGSQIADSIWVMEEYKMQLSWTRRHIVMAPHMYPVCITKSGDVVGRYGFEELVKFNYKGEVLEHRHYAQDHPEKCFGSTMDVVMHIDSLLPLPCDS